MKRNLIQRLLSVSIVAMTALFGLANTAQATRNVPPTVTEKKAAPVVLSMEQLNQRVATLPEFSTLKKGDTVTLYDDGSVTDAIWQGTYVWYPAGSVVPRSAMYARWKDGIVTLTPNISGTLDAKFVEQAYQLDKRPAIANDAGILSPVQEWQTTKTLIKEPTASDILRIPNNAYLFRVDANGQMIALVDVLVYQSGPQPIPHQEWLPGMIPTGTGAQPVPVSAHPAKW